MKSQLTSQTMMMIAVLIWLRRGSKTFRGMNGEKSWTQNPSKRTLFAYQLALHHYTWLHTQLGNGCMGMFGTVILTILDWLTVDDLWLNCTVHVRMNREQLLSPFFLHLWFKIFFFSTFIIHFKRSRRKNFYGMNFIEKEGSVCYVYIFLTAGNWNFCRSTFFTLFSLNRIEFFYNKKKKWMMVWYQLRITFI